MRHFIGHLSFDLLLGYARINSCFITGTINFGGIEETF